MVGLNISETICFFKIGLLEQFQYKGRSVSTGCTNGIRKSQNIISVIMSLCSPVGSFRKDSSTVIEEQVDRINNNVIIFY